MPFILDFRLDDRGGPVVPGILIDTLDGASGQAAIRRLAQVEQVVFLVHGFNVTRPRGRASLLKLAGLLPAARSQAVVGVLWPGDSWARAASYSFEGRDADDTAAQLVRFLGDIFPRGATVSFAAHSLGCRVVLETVRALDAGFAVDQVALMAGAVDDYSLAWSRAYRAAVQRAKRVAVLASRCDDVLRLAYPIGDLLQAFLFFWRDEPRTETGPRAPPGGAGRRAAQADRHREPREPRRLPAERQGTDQQEAARSGRLARRGAERQAPADLLNGSLYTATGSGVLANMPGL
jgi:esterase/lipase superfamily enzyme